MATTSSTSTASAPEPSTARLVGHGIAVIVGVLAVIAGFVAMAKSLPGAMSITLVVVGGVMLVMTRYSLQNSRAAWSLLVAILAVFALVTLFGAPTIRKLVHINLGIALIIPLVQIIAVVALAMIRDNYRDE